MQQMQLSLKCIVITMSYMPCLLNRHLAHECLGEIIAQVVVEVLGWVHLQFTFHVSRERE